MYLLLTMFLAWPSIVAGLPIMAENAIYHG